MPNTVLVGTQWGDEGKGKIIDVLAQDVDMVVRFQGGNNAGHTVKIGDAKYVLHLIPSGILREGQQCVIGNGMVVDPLALLEEMAEIKSQGMDLDGRLFISDRAHVVCPFHKALDACREDSLPEDQKIGTTKRGIGPAYGDKITRVGLRMCDLLDPDFKDMLLARAEEVNETLTHMGGTALDTGKMVEDYLDAAEKLAPCITDTITMVNEAVKAGKSVLFEGAQGTMLDIDFGTYPYVTSSNTTVGGACVGTGLPPTKVDRVIGVIKAYTTRVGEGPFTTELFDDVGAHIAEKGGEFGATTGRPRRCGWFDGVVAKYSAMVNGVDYWAMMKLDVLDELETLKICTAYECDGKIYEAMPANIRILERCKPVYEEMEGWMESTEEVTSFDDLPEKAKAYVNRLCEISGAELGVLSVGPKRKSTIRIAI